MSLPTFINLYSDNLLSSENLIQDHNTSFLLSLKESSGLSEKSLGINLREDTFLTPIESHGSFVDLDSETLTKVESESVSSMFNRTSNVARILRNSTLEYHIRNSVQFSYNSTEKLYNPICLRADFVTQIESMKEVALSNWNFTQLPGSNPQSWPNGLANLNKKLASLPELSFFNEPFEVNEPFKIKAKQFIFDTIAEIKRTNATEDSEHVQHLIAALNALITISYHTGCFSEILEALKLVSEVDSALASTKINLTEKFHNSFGPTLQRFKNFASGTSYIHHINNLCDEGGFKISKVQHFQKQNFYNTSLATDGSYLYIYVSSVNGGMYKVGTGEGGTTPGKIYLYSPVTKVEEISWVYCRGKLYLRNNSREMGTLEVIDPVTFKQEGFLQIYCPEIFGHPSLQLINRNYPLLTDGEYVYLIGKKLISEKLGADKPEEDKDKEKKEEATKAEEKKVEPKQPEAQQSPVQKVLQGQVQQVVPSDVNQSKPVEIKPVESKPQEVINNVQTGEIKPELIKSEEKPVEKSPEKPIEIPAEKSAEKPDEKPAEKAAEKSAEKPAEKSAEKPVEKSAEQPAEKKDEIPIEFGLESFQSPDRSKDEKKADGAEKVSEDKLKVNMEDLIVPSLDEANELPKIESSDDSAALKKKLPKEPKEKKKKEPKKKEEKPASESEPTLKLCEYILYEFDITDLKGLDFIDQSEIGDRELVQELYESFNGYFTFNECARALSFNKDDIQNAAQWLVDEGDRERNKKTILVRNQTLLAQAEVTSDISSKQLKNNVELITKEDSIIFPNNITSNIWTMNRTHVALYCESGIKVFSKDPKDVHVINDTELFNQFKPQFVQNTQPAAYTNWNNYGNAVSKEPSRGIFGEKEPRRFEPTTTTTQVTSNIFSKPAVEAKNLLFGGSQDIRPPTGGGIFYKPLSENREDWGDDNWGERQVALELNNQKATGGLLGSKRDEMINAMNEKQKFLDGISNLEKAPEKKLEKPAAVIETEKKPRPKVELKGTFIKIFDNGRKAYHGMPGYNICYDPYNKKFLTFTWIWDSHTNIFPSLITMTYDPERYSSSSLHCVELCPPKELKECNLQDYITLLLEELLEVQKKRFFLPSRLRNWDYMYGWVLNDINNKKISQGTLDEEAKKKYTNQKTKLLQRLSKVKSSVTPRVKSEEMKPALKKNLTEIKREYALCVDGSIKSLKLIIDLLKTKEETLNKALNENQIQLLVSQGVYPYLQLLFLWIKHADILSGYKDQEPEELIYLENLLTIILTHQVNSAENLGNNELLYKINCLAWRTLINGWDILVRTTSRQSKWIQLIISSVGKYKIAEKENIKFNSESLNQNGLSPLVYFYLKFAHFPASFTPEFPLRDYQIESVRDYEAYIGVDDKEFNITKYSQSIKIREENFVEPHGRLLIEDLSYLEYAKNYDNQFEDVYASYFVHENRQVLKIEKPKEEPKVENKEPPKAVKGKGKEKEEKPKTKIEPTKELKKSTKAIKPKEEEKKAEDVRSKKVINVDPELIKAHRDNAKKLLLSLEKGLSEIAFNPTNENILLWKVFLKLFMESWIDLEKIEEGEIEWMYKKAFIEQILPMLDRVLDNYSNKLFEIIDKTPAIASKLIEYINSLICSISSIIYQSSITKNFGCEAVAVGFIKIYEKIKRFLDFNDEKLGKGNLLEQLIAQNNEGIDFLSEKVVETNHPYERGKTINFDPITFPGAIAIAVEFDKRCQSDVSHDFIALSSSNENLNSYGFWMSQNNQIGVSFRISGKPNMKKPLVLLGNHLQVDFTSSGQAKLKIRPIYGSSNYILKDNRYLPLLSSFQAKFGGEKTLNDFFSTLGLVSLVIIETIDLYVKGGLLADKEKQLSKFLRWHLLKGGIEGTEVSQYLTPNNGIYQLNAKPVYQDLENYSFDDKFEAIKEEIYLRVSKYSSQKEGAKQNEEEFIKKLFELKDPTILSFLEEVKNQKGSFYDFMKQMRLLVAEPLMLKSEKMRQTFKPEYKALWEEGEGYLLLAMLHHSGLLRFLIDDNGAIKFPTDQHIKDQLVQIGENRNKIYMWMLSQVQAEREWQQTLDEISEQRNKYIDEKRRIEEEEREKQKKAQEAKALEAASKKQEAEKKEKEKKLPENSTKNIKAEKSSKIQVRPSSRPTGFDSLKAKGQAAKKPNTQPLKKKEESSSENEAEEEKVELVEEEEEEKADTPRGNKEHDFEEKLDDIILKNLAKRYEGASIALNLICNLKNIDTAKDSIQLLRDIYEIAKVSLKALKKDANKHYIIQFTSPYEILARSLIDMSKFLLKINSHFKKPGNNIDSSPSKLETNSISELEEEPELLPIAANRSFSSAQESQINNQVKNRLENLRELVSSYQKWKEWHHRVEEISDDYYWLDNASPLKSVVALIMKRVSSKDLELCLKNQLVRASQRVIGVQMVQNIYEILANTPYERFFFGLISQNFTDDYLTNINCAPQDFKNLAETFILNILNQLLISFNLKMNSLKSLRLKQINSLLNKTKGISQGLLKWKNLMQQSLSALSSNLRDIIALVSNAKILKKVFSTDESQLKAEFSAFNENLIVLALISQTFTYLSHSYDPLLTISTNCIHNVTCFTHLLQENFHQPTLNQTLEFLLKHLKKEIGLSKQDSTSSYTLNARILHRANDPIVIERLEYFLTLSRAIFKKADLSKFPRHILNELAFILFTVAYHHNAPKIVKSISKVFEILIPHIDFSSLPTPYDISYYFYQFKDWENMLKAGKTQAAYKFNPEDLAHTPLTIPPFNSKAEGAKPDNALTLFEKLGDQVLMRKADTISLNNIIDNNLLKSEACKTTNYAVVLQLSNEEDLMFLVRVLYFWEEKYPTFSTKFPKTIEEYLKHKESLAKKEAEIKARPAGDKSSSPQLATSESYFKTNEYMFTHFPDLNLLAKSEDELPFGWEYNVLGNYSDSKFTKHEFKRSKTRKIVKKVWANSNLIKLDKKMEEVLKSIEEFKDTDSEEEKLQNIQARVFVWRMQYHIKEVNTIATLLNIYGFSAVLDAYPLPKALELASLINLGLNKKLQNIPIEHFKEEIRKKVDPTNLNPLNPQVDPNQQSQPVLQKQPTTTIKKDDKDAKSEMRISICASHLLFALESNADYLSILNSPKETFYADANKIPIIHHSILSGNAATILINELINFSRSLLGQSDIARFVMPKAQKIFEAFSANTLETLTNFDKSVFAGVASILGGWSEALKPGSNVIYEDVTSKRVTLVFGGPTSGKNTSQIIMPNDVNLTVQSVPTQKLHPKLRVALPEGISINPAVIIKCVKMLSNSYEKIQSETNNDVHIETSLILRALLRISQSIDWSAVITNDASISKEDFANFITFLMKICKNCPADHGYEHYEARYTEAWEALVDKKNPRNHILFYPSSFNSKSEFASEESADIGNIALERKESQGPQFAEGLLPPSIYISCLPEYQPLVSEYKMLKYWEKNIIPKIQDFVRSSYKPWEFEEFFEQLRQPLRNSDHNKAAEIAYILCDQRLPNGCVLPEPNHDWSTISIEEIVLGSWAIATIGAKRNKLMSPFFQNQAKFGNREALVHIVSTDIKSSSVLVYYHDPEILQTVAVWLPVTCLKFPELPLQHPASSMPFEVVLENYKNSASQSMGLLARGSIFKFYSFGKNDVNLLKKEAEIMKSYSISLVNLLKWAALDEFNEDAVEGWLSVNESEIELEKPKKKQIMSAQDIIINATEEKAKPKSAKLETLKHVLQNVVEAKDNNELDSIMKWAKETLDKVVRFLNLNTATVDLQKPYPDAPAYVQGGPRPIYSLNKCLPDFEGGDDLTVSSMTLAFKKESSLCLNSGVKFFDDPNGINMIQHVPAGKETRTKLPSLIFKQSQVYFSYYFNAEALPPYLQSQCASVLQAVIHAIPSQFSVILWTLDTISTAALKAKSLRGYEELKKIIQIVVEALKEFKGPLVIKNHLLKLLNRCMRKVRYIIDYLPEVIPKGDKKNPDAALKSNLSLLQVDESYLKTIIEEVKSLRENQSIEVVVLYSSYTQELVEYVANCLIPLNCFAQSNFSNAKFLQDLNVQSWIWATVNTWIILQYFKNESPLTQDLLNEVMGSLMLDTQWERFLFVQNIPFEYSKQEIVDKFTQIILNHKGRILNPKIDIWVPTTTSGDKECHQGFAIVLIDGWSVFGLEEEPSEEEKKKAEEEEVKEEEEEPQEPEMWDCPVCTYANSRDTPMCEMCETAKPPYVRPQPAAEQVTEVEHTDLAEIDSRLKEREKEKLEKIATDIKNFIAQYYDDLRVKLDALIAKEAKDRAEAEKRAAEAPQPEVETKGQQGLDEEARKLKNKEKKLALKEQKKKEQEEKEKKKLEKKSKKKGGAKDEAKGEEKKEEEEKAQNPAEEKPVEEVTVSTEKSQPTQEKIEEPELTPEQIEKLRIQDILAIEAKADVSTGGSIFTKNPSPLLNTFLKNRLFNTDGKLRPSVEKVLTGIFNGLVSGADRILESFKSSIHGVDISKLSKTKVEEFLADIAARGEKNCYQVWKFLEAFGYDLWLNQSGCNLIQESFKEIKLLPPRALEQLMEFMQFDLCHQNKSVINYPPNNIRPAHDPNTLQCPEEPPVNYTSEAILPVRYKYLDEFKLHEIRYAWSVIKVFNRYLSESIDFINTTSANPFTLNAKWFNLGTYLSALRNYWMTPIKIELSSKIMQKTAIARDNVPKVQVERLKLGKEKEKGEKEKEKQAATLNEIVSYKYREDYIFTKAYEQLKDVSTTLFRPVKPTGSDPFLAFEVLFKGEMVMGEAGPYRQFFADISQELQPNNVSVTSLHKNLNLLCPSPNNYSKLGEGRDKFVINPSALSPYQLQLYEFLGILMGCSIRTGTHLTLDLPTMFWKQLTNQNISLEDLEAVDKPITDLMHIMEECTKEGFEDLEIGNYTFKLSDNSDVELIPGGSKIPVKFEDRFDFINRVVQTRVNESKIQIDAIRRGLTKLVPQPFLNNVSAHDVEIWVCGQSKVDVDLLKRHTRYSSGLNEEAPRVKFLWETLKELSETEKLRFVKFCWGQERLPANDEEFERTQTRFMIKPATYSTSQPNKALPKADTCFFNLELPAYTTKEFLKERLLLAINTDCDSINADQVVDLDPNAQHNRRDRDDNGSVGSDNDSQY